MDEDERIEEPYEGSSPGQEDDDGGYTPDIEYDDQNLRPDVRESRAEVEARQSALLRERYARQQEQDEETPPAVAAETQQQAGGVTPPAQETKYKPEYGRGSMSTEERAATKQKLAATLSTYDSDAMADQILDLIEERSARNAAVLLDNYLAARVQTSSDQIEALAERNLLNQAHQNPAILDDPTAGDVARYAAALQIGMKTGDLHGMVKRVLEARGPKPAAPPAKQEQQTRRPTGESLPANMAVPTGGGGASTGGRRPGPASDKALLARALPYADADWLESR